MSEEEAFGLAIVVGLVGLGVGFRAGYWSGKRDLLHAFISASAHSAPRVTHQE